MIQDEKSILPVVQCDGDLNAFWGEIRQAAGRHLDEQGVNRFRQILDHRIRTVAVERHYIDKDYRDTFSNYHSKRFATPDSRCVRLHFFSAILNPNEIPGSAPLQEAYLGYAVIRPTRPNSVGRTLILPDKHLLGESHISMTKEQVSLLGNRLEVVGFPFISQDADVTVCAQSAVWMLSRYFSNRYPIYAEIGPYQIGQLTTDYSIGRMYPSGGLDMWQMAEALKRMGFHPLIYNRRSYSNLEFEHFLYTYLESRIPCLLGVPGHVIVGYGHRSNFKAWVKPDADGFIHSGKFNRAYVVSDDNCHPYQILHKRGRRPHDSRYTFDDIDSFVVPLPEKVFLPAEAALKGMRSVIKQFQSQSGIFADQPMVLRSYLTSVRAFKEHVLVRGMGNTMVKEIYRQLPMPHFIWICEFSIPEDYPERVWGEIIWDATRNAYEPGGWIALHFPEFFIIDRGSALNGIPEIERFPLQSSQSYPIFESNLTKIQ